MEVCLRLGRVAAATEPQPAAEPSYTEPSAALALAAAAVSLAAAAVSLAAATVSLAATALALAAPLAAAASGPAMGREPKPSRQ